jgi:hypothetical protein
MPKFVKLLIDDEATMLVNLETVTKIKEGDEEENSGNLSRTDIIRRQIIVG